MGAKKISQAEITKRLTEKNHKGKWFPLSSAEPPSLGMLFSNKYFKLDIVHIDICILPECFLQKAQSEYIRREKALSSYGGKKAKGKKGSWGRQKLKWKLKCHCIYAQGPHPDYPPKC